MIGIQIIIKKKNYNIVNNKDILQFLIENKLLLKIFFKLKLVKIK